MAEAEEKKCKCPGCNCFAGLVHVPKGGSYVVFPGGRVEEISNARHEGHAEVGDDRYDIYTITVKEPRED
jgi:hypothetical protein